MNGRFEVAVTGIGMVTPAGIGVAESWRRICLGESTARPDPDLSGMPVDFTCRVPGFNADDQLGRRTAWRQERFVHLARVAAREAVADAGLDPAHWNSARVGVVMGNSLGGSSTYEQQLNTLRAKGPHGVSPLMIPMIGVGSVTGEIAIDCSATGPNLTTVTACASAATAIGTARELLRSGMCDVVITGGTESALSPTLMAGFTQLGALSRRVDDPAAASRPFDADRDGFVASEGAGVLVLERAADALVRKATIRAMISGYGASADAHHMTAPRPDGACVEQATRAALADAGVLPDEVDHVNAHGTSTPLNDVTEARLIRRVFGDRPVITSVKGAIGHSLAAAGGIEAICTVLAIQHGVVPPTANLVTQDPEIELDIVAKVPREMPIRVAVSNSIGFGGANAVLVLTAA
ncbi:beta-ketoacyl-[acyl-carrier-protein] synthase family protein [Amycolatopsis sp. NPDC049868]|uniref:beta-ketoacyl-[acyl-carrier-protein] synthase family protein n=1 Tax=Amycolatopsis sp. NPDC049868 TaxID=3363934 RepID=UPI003789DFC5